MLQFAVFLGQRDPSKKLKQQNVPKQNRIPIYFFKDATLHNNCALRRNRFHHTKIQEFSKTAGPCLGVRISCSVICAMDPDFEKLLRVGASVCNGRLCNFLGIPNRGSILHVWVHSQSSFAKQTICQDDKRRKCVINLASCFNATCGDAIM